MIKLCQLVIEQDGELKYLETVKEIVEVNTPVLQFPFEVQCEILQFESEEAFQNLSGEVINLTRNIIINKGDGLNPKSIRQVCLEKLQLQEDLQGVV